MSPPINIDGTQITGASIDGTDVSEITVDGTTVFSGIPDSVVHRWPVDEGSGSTLNDAVGNINMTITGASFITGANFVGGVALDYDGIDDNSKADSKISTLDSSPFSFEIWANLDDHSGGGVIAHQRDTQRLALTIDKNNNSRVAWSVDGTNIAQGSIPSGLAQFVGTYNGSGGSLFINKTAVGDSGGNTDGPGTSTRLRIAEKADGSSQTNIDGDLFQVHDEVLSSSQVTDLFNSHPST